MDDFEERVRIRAFRLWQEEGCPEGRADVHWDLARELVAIEENIDLTLRPIPDPGSIGPYGEPVEPLEAVENTGEFPTLTDQGEEQTFPNPDTARSAGAGSAGDPDYESIFDKAGDRGPNKASNRDNQ